MQFMSFFGPDFVPRHPVGRASRVSIQKVANLQDYLTSELEAAKPFHYVTNKITLFTVLRTTHCVKCGEKSHSQKCCQPIHFVQLR